MEDRTIWDINKLREWDKNPRSITKEGLERLKKQIVKLGQYKPLVITPDGEVLRGNMRLKAYRELGIKDIWVSVVDIKGGKQKIDYALSDNDRAGFYEFDEVTLLMKDFPEIEWQDYTVDLQPAPQVTFLPQPFFLSTLFDRADIETLKPNKYSYRQHPPEQIDHLVKSIQQNGIYKNILITKDGTILDGHAVVQAAKKLDIKIVPVKILQIEPDSDQALKIIVSNNEMGKFTEVDDRKLTEILKEIKEKGDAGLLGTGFDNQKLANLLMVTRSANEINSKDSAAEWVGMPEYQGEANHIQIIVNFRSVEDKIALLKLLGEPPNSQDRSIWYPHKEREDLTSVKFQDAT